MDQPASTSSGRSGVWLAHLIEAAEVVAASAEACDGAIVKAFSHRLEQRADVGPLVRFCPHELPTVKPVS
jgi:hypothetical protein